jgi:stage II sporulation protein AB (anti-sigma F factor)
LADVKTAVSEAVTNAIIHGYENGQGVITMICKLYADSIEVAVIDKGKGIENIEKARQPMFTTKPDLERSGMGFTVMESFMDSVEVYSKPGEGTTVILKKGFGKTD